MMRILIVGEDHPWSSETAYAREFRRAGCDVEIWNNKRPRFPFGRADWWKLGRAQRAAYDVLASLAFARKARAWKPDVIFLPKADNIHSRAVRTVLQETKARLVMWYPDHPFKSDMTSMNVLRNLRRADIFYIWGKFLLEPLSAAGAHRVAYLPFAFDPDTHPLTNLEREDTKKFACEVCFVGAWDKEREHDLEPLAAFDLAIWGPGWSAGLSANSPLRGKVRGGGLYNEDMAKAYRCAAVVFNHLRLHNGSAHNMRAMEIAGIGGGVQLVRRTPELARELFEEDKDLVCYESAEEMRAQIAKALASPEIREAMSDSARRRVYADHLLMQRVAAILGDIRGLDK